jgi:CheY-like chemotaxis protein
MTAYLARKQSDNPRAVLAPGRESAPLVMVAEDHEDTRFLLRTVLERRGLAVVEAGDGEEAVSLAERETPDLILMDGSLPRLDGISATRRMRGMASLSAVPIVFLSGHAGPQQQLAAREAGCDDYLVKPLELGSLYHVLERHLPKGDGAAGATESEQLTRSDL